MNRCRQTVDRRLPTGWLWLEGGCAHQHLCHLSSRISGNSLVMASNENVTDTLWKKTTSIHYDFENKMNTLKYDNGRFVLKPLHQFACPNYV